MGKIIDRVRERQFVAKQRGRRIAEEEALHRWNQQRGGIHEKGLPPYVGGMASLSAAAVSELERNITWTPSIPPGSADRMADLRREIQADAFYAYPRVTLAKRLRQWMKGGA